MFVIPAICFVGGLVAMGRTKPQTGVRKLLCLGPRSGLVYQVEDFPEVGTVIVRPQTKTAVVQFIRASVREPGKPGLLFMNAAGDPRLIDLIRKDFGVEPKPLAVVPSPAAARPMSAAAAALTSEQRALYWSTLVYRAPESLSADQKRIVDAMKDEPDPQARAASAPPKAPPAPAASKGQQTGRSTP